MDSRQLLGDTRSQNQIEANPSDVLYKEGKNASPGERRDVQACDSSRSVLNRDERLREDKRSQRDGGIGGRRKMM